MVRFIHYKEDEKTRSSKKPLVLLTLFVLLIGSPIVYEKVQEAGRKENLHSMTTFLQEVYRHQEQFRRKKSRYAASLDELDMEPPPGINVSFPTPQNGCYLVIAHMDNFDRSVSISCSGETNIGLWH